MAMRQDGRRPEGAGKGTPETGSGMGLAVLVERFTRLAGALTSALTQSRWGDRRLLPLLIVSREPGRGADRSRRLGG
jgi:hypothetical protein